MHITYKTVSNINDWQVLNVAYVVKFCTGDHFNIKFGVILI